MPRQPAQAAEAVRAKLTLLGDPATDLERGGHAQVAERRELLDRLAALEHEVLDAGGTIPHRLDDPDPTAVDDTPLPRDPVADVTPAPPGYLTEF